MSGEGSGDRTGLTTSTPRGSPPPSYPPHPQGPRPSSFPGTSEGIAVLRGTFRAPDLKDTGSGPLSFGHEGPGGAQRWQKDGYREGGDSGSGG